jgi:hypothetical protein
VDAILPFLSNGVNLSAVDALGNDVSGFQAPFDSALRVFLGPQNSEHRQSKFVEKYLAKKRGWPGKSANVSQSSSSLAA